MDYYEELGDRNHARIRALELFQEGYEELDLWNLETGEHTVLSLRYDGLGHS